MSGFPPPHWDAQGFIQIHEVWTNSWLDRLLPVWRDRRTWIPLYLLLVFFIVRARRKGALLVIAMAAACVGSADYLSSSVIKPLVGRLRPCRAAELEGHIRNIIDCGPGLSFPSSHAANHFALAVFLWVLFRRQYPTAAVIGLMWAASIAYAQVYVGLHYPLDILAGSILGALLGGLFSFLFNLLERRFTWSSR